MVASKSGLACQYSRSLLTPLCLGCFAKRDVCASAIQKFKCMIRNSNVNAMSLLKNQSIFVEYILL